MDPGWHIYGAEVGEVGLPTRLAWTIDVQRPGQRDVHEIEVRLSKRPAAALDACKTPVLGDPVYYARFGFVPAARFGLKCPFPARDDSFMAIELEPGAFAKASGPVRYGHEFDDLG